MWIYWSTAPESESIALLCHSLQLHSASRVQINVILPLSQNTVQNAGFSLWEHIMFSFSCYPTEPVMVERRWPAVFLPARASTSELGLSFDVWRIHLTRISSLHVSAIRTPHGVSGPEGIWMKSPNEQLVHHSTCWRSTAWLSVRLLCGHGGNTVNLLCS